MSNEDRAGRTKPKGRLKAIVADKKRHDAMSRKWFYSILGVLLLGGPVAVALAAIRVVSGNAALYAVGGLSISISAFVFVSNHSKVFSERVGTPWVDDAIAHFSQLLWRRRP